MTPIKLISVNGCLEIPHAMLAESEKPLFEGNYLLTKSYAAGDCDTVKWPAPNKDHLTSSLFDAREMGLIPDVRSVTLPDGTEFAF